MAGSRYNTLGQLDLYVFCRSTFAYRDIIGPSALATISFGSVVQPSRTALQWQYELIYLFFVYLFVWPMEVFIIEERQ